MKTKTTLPLLSLALGLTTNHPELANLKDLKP
jgi:hypothetical protein